MLTPLLTFALCAAVIIYCGKKLSFYGDIIAEKSGLGRAWLGLILMSSVTSLPELVAGISSVAIIDAPNLAIGDVVGSCMFNLLILSLLDVFYKEGAIMSRVQQSQIIGAGFGVILITLVAASLVFKNVLPAVGWVGVYSIVFAGVYFAAIRTIYVYESRKPKAEETHVVEEGVSLKKAIQWYVVNAAFVFIAAMFLPHAGEQIAELSGLGQTFVGTLLIAASTSLPEMVVSISAVRMGSVDLAVGNIFGSNIFNIFILALDDLFYLKGPLLQAASANHVISLFSVLIMTGIAIVGLVFQQEKKRWIMAVDTFLIFITYVGCVVLLYYTKDM